MRTTIRKVIASLCILQIFCVGIPLSANAAMIGTDTAIETSQRAEHRQTVDAFMAQEQVRQQLLDWGVAADQVEERLAALTDAELRDLATRMDDAPAGGLLGVIGVVFVVLIILELVGVTDVFTAIGPAK